MKNGNKLFYGWWIVTAITIISFTTAATPFSVVLKQLMQEFNSGRGMVSLAPSISMIAGGITGIVVGRLLKTRKPKIFMLYGAIIGGLSLLLISIAHSLWTLYVFFFLLGVAVGGITMISMFSLLSKWFTRKWGTAVGFATAGGAVGNMAITPLYALIMNTFGWRATYVLSGLLVLLIDIPLICFVLKDSPESMGLYSDGIKTNIPEESETIPRENAGVKLTISDYLKRFPLWLIGISLALVAIGDNAVMQHQVSFLTDMNISTTIAASALGFTFGISIIAKLGSGWLADRISTRYVTILFLILEVAGIFVLMKANTISKVWLFVVIYGLGAGAAGTLMPLIIREVFGSAYFSILFSFANILYTAGAVIGIPLAGFIFDATASYSMVFVIVASAYMAAILGIYIAFGINPKPIMLTSPQKGVSYGYER